MTRSRPLARPCGLCRRRGNAALPGLGFVWFVYFVVDCLCGSHLCVFASLRFIFAWLAWFAVTRSAARSALGFVCLRCGCHSRFTSHCGFAAGFSLSRIFLHEQWIPEASEGDGLCANCCGSWLSEKHEPKLN